MNDTETIDYRGYVITLEQDDSAMCPRFESERFATLLMHHRRYALACDERIDWDEYDGWDDLQRSLEREHGPGLYLPVYMYDHSGLAFSTTPFADQWDSMRVGIVVVTKHKLAMEYDGDTGVAAQEKARNVIAGELREYEQWVSGDCWGVAFNKPGEEPEMVYGYYGYQETLDYAKEEIDRLYRIKQRNVTPIS